MTASRDNTFLMCSQDNQQVEWLSGALASLGKVIQVGDNLDELIRLAGLVSASVVFVGMDGHGQVQQRILIEAVVEACPMVAVVAVGDAYDSDLVISAMRAGARDFVTYGLRSSEVIGLVRRLVDRLPQIVPRQDQASMTVIYGAQPDADAALVAANLALELIGGQRPTLLLDLGIPQGESVAMLGLDCTFFVDDAFRNLRRLDSTVIESAFCKHHSGLQILPLGADDGFDLSSCPSAELFLLLGILRQHFGRILVNASGQPDCEPMRSLAASAEPLLWYIDQSVACSRRNLARVQRWRGDGIRLDRCRLVVDRYLGRYAPDAETLAHTLDIPVVATLPPSPGLRLKSRNEGKSVLELAPRDGLSRTLKALARQLGSPQNPDAGLVRRLRELVSGSY